MFWLGAAVALCYVPGYTGAYIATQWPLLAIALWFGLLREGPLTGWHWTGLVFVTYATVHAFFTPMPYASVYGLWLVWIMALSLWLGTTLKDPRKLYAGLAAGAAVSSFLAVLQFFGVNFPERVTDAPAGLLANNVQLGTVLALITVVLASERMWLWALPLLPGIALSGSRGAWFALAVGLLACRVRSAWLFVFIGAAVAFYMVALPLSPSDQLRVLIWKAAWNSLTLWGWGPGVFFGILLPHDGILRSSANPMFYPETAHNDALQLVFEYGIGAALPLAIFAFAAWRTRDSAWPLVVAFFAAGCCSMPLYMPAAAFLVLVAVGHGLRCHAVACGYRSGSGQSFLSWRRTVSGKVVPLAPHYSTEGRTLWR